MVAGNDQFLIIGSIAMSVIAFVLYNNKLKRDKERRLAANKAAQNNIKLEKDQVFYLYKHNSNQEWLRWIRKQDRKIQEKAATMFKIHLNGPLEQWCYITIEALDCIKEFNAFSLDEFVASVFERCSHNWNKLGNIQDYYFKAAEILIELNPDLAVKTFQTEITTKDYSQSAIERRRNIIARLPELKEKSIQLMIDILSNPKESYGTKVFTLRKCGGFDAELKNKIYLEALKLIIEKIKSQRSPISNEEAHFIEDLIEGCVQCIKNLEFFKILNEASQLAKLQPLVIKHVRKALENPQNKLSKFDLFAMSHLKDNNEFEICNTLAKTQELISEEVANIVMQASSGNLKRNELIYADSNQLNVPIPTILRASFNDFKSRFFENIDDHNYVTSEKIYGGVLVTGNEALEKLYFSRALAKDENWNFAHIDIAKINNKANYDRATAAYNKLKKPYLLYIINPHLLFERGSSEQSSLRERFIQTLTTQSLDTKSFLVGDILGTNKKINNSSIYERLAALRNKFFPQTLEMNTKDEAFKYTVIEEYLKNIPEEHLENRRELVKQFYDRGQGMSVLEFSFFVVKYLKLMLLIFGKTCDLTLVDQLAKDFFGDKNSKQNKDSSNEEDEVSKI